SRLAGTNPTPSPAARSAVARDPITTGSVRRPTTRSPGSSPKSLTISRTRWSHAASTQGTTPAAGRPTARAPYSSGSPATSAAARFPAKPRRLSIGEYTSITPRAARPTSTAAPPTSAAAPRPSRIPPTTHKSAVPRDKCPAANGRSSGRRFTRSASASQMSFAALPAAPNPTPATAANSTSGGGASPPAAAPPPAGPHPLRRAALAGRHAGHAARHRLERRQPERFARRRQQKQIPPAQQLGDLIDLAEEANVATQLQPVRLLLGQVALRPVTREHE